MQIKGIFNFPQSQKIFLINNQLHYFKQKIILPFLMKKNVFFLFYESIIVCLQEKIVCNVSQIHSIIDNSQFIKLNLVHFYDFNEPINLKNLILHYKNIMEKFIDINFGYHIFDEYHLDKKLFDSNMDCVKFRIADLNYILFRQYDFISLLKKLELELFKFVFKKIFEITKYEFKEDTFIVIMNKDYNDTILLLNWLKAYKNNVKKKKNLKIYETKIISEIVDKELVILNELKIHLFETLERNNILTESSKFYLHNIENLGINTTINFDKKRNLQSFIRTKLKELEYCLKKNYDLCNLHDVNIIKLNLCKIANIIVTISKINFLELQISLFIKIFIYYNFLRNKIVLSEHHEKNLDISTKNKDKNYELRSSKLYEILTLIFTHKNLICNLIDSYCFNICRKNSYNKKLRIKCRIYKNFINLESYFDKLVNFYFYEEDCKQQCQKILCNHIKMLKQLHMSFFIFQESFFNDFAFFQVQCILLFNHNTLYLGTKRNYKTNCQCNLNRLICQSIDLIMIFFRKIEIINSNYSDKYDFLKIMIEKLEECYDVLKKFLPKRNKKKYKKNDEFIKKIFLTVFKFQHDLYEVFCNNINETVSTNIES
ncbi:hypothetical protein NUSPORA_00757 [Nucleospora cyclopteri]